MKISIIIEPDEDVFTAYCPELKGCATFGKTEALGAGEHQRCH
jgi:predicted RNase H-like HicB family nuclease